MDTEQTKKMREEIAAVTRKRKCKSKTSIEWWVVFVLGLISGMLGMLYVATIFISASLIICRLDRMECENANC